MKKERHWDPVEEKYLSHLQDGDADRIHAVASAAWMLILCVMCFALGGVVMSLQKGDIAGTAVIPSAPVTIPVTLSQPLAAPTPAAEPVAESVELFSGSPDVQLQIGGFHISEQQFADCMNLVLLEQPRMSFCPEWPLLKARLLGYDVADLVPDWQLEQWFTMQRSMDDFRGCVALQEQSGVVRDCNPLLEPHHEAYQALVNGGVR